jgi:hypothetical protein
MSVGAAVPKGRSEKAARLLRDAQMLEARWLEVGTALEIAEAGLSAGTPDGA